MTALTLPRPLTLQRVREFVHTHPFACILFVGIALRLLFIFNAAFSYDESGSRWMASLPWDRLIAATAGDTHPPLYFLMLSVWSIIAGTGEAALRLPSAFFSAASIWLTYRLGERLNFDKAAVVLGAVLMAILPGQLFHAQDARMYALLTFEFLLGVLFATRRRWVLMAVTLSAMYWTHNYGLIFAISVDAMALGAIWIFPHAEKRERYKALLGCALANLAALASWLSWFNVLRGQMGTIASGYWLPAITPGELLITFFKIVWSQVMPLTVQSHAALLLFGALTFALVRAVVVRDRRALALAVLAGLPLAAVCAASAIWRPILLFRGLMPITPLLCLLFGWAFTDGIGRRGRLTAAMFAAPVIAACVVGYYVQLPQYKVTVTDYIASMDVGTLDVVYHLNEGSVYPFHTYAPEWWRQYMMPHTDYENIGGLTPQTRAALGIVEAPLDKLEWQRVWVIRASGPYTVAAEDEALEALLAKYPHELIYDYPTELSHDAVYLLTRP